MVDLPDVHLAARLSPPSFRRTVGFGALVAGLAACVMPPAPSSEIEQRQAADDAVVVVTIAPGAGTAIPTSIPTTTVPVDRAALVAACVEYVPTAAFAGDVAMSALWNQLGQSIEQLTAHCGMLADTDVSQLVTMSNAMAEIRARWDAQASTPTIGIVVVPTAPMTVPPAETCRIMDTNGDGVTDQCVPVNMIP